METNENKIATTPCKVCGKPILLTAEFCSNCGFPNIIYPDSISKKVRDYENDRVKKYKDLWESKNKGEKFPPLRGYLVMQYGEKISRIYPIYEGKNVFGVKPQSLPGIFTHTLVPVISDLKNNHFSLEPEEEGNGVIAKLIEGEWRPSNVCINSNEVLLESSDSFEIGEIRFSYFVSK